MASKLVKIFFSHQEIITLLQNLNNDEKNSCVFSAHYFDRMFE